MKKYLNKENILLLFIFSIGVFIRLLYLGEIPNGINCDEAYAAYNAFNLINYGVDAHGYANPVYFTSWGSGMNALEIYLMIPFIKLFGLNSFAIRLPQVIIAIASLVFFYLLLKEIFNKKMATIGLFLLSICPWHIMLSRWALESNLAPGMILIGLYFFVKGLKNSKFLILSAIFYGLALYAYATIWMVLPFIILFQLLYGLITKQLKLDRYLIFFIIILGIFAIPLFIFIAVNVGIIDEIKLSFISFPKMTQFRASDVSDSIIQKVFYFMNVMFFGYDNLAWNSVLEYGLFYRGSIIFFLIGFANIIMKARENKNLKIIFINYIIFLSLGILIVVNINRINCIHFFTLIFITYGVYNCFEFFERFKIKDILKTLLISFFISSFLFFSHYYFTDYKDVIGVEFNDGLEEAIEFAENKNPEEIVFCRGIQYSNVLLIKKIPYYEFLKGDLKIVERSRDYLVNSFCNYYFDDFEDMDALFEKNPDCIITLGFTSYLFEDTDYKLEKFNEIYVYYK